MNSLLKSFFCIYSVVDEDCFRYSAEQETCKVKRTGNLANTGCRLPTMVPRKDFYKMGPAYSLRNETDIKYEILHYGPVQGNFFLLNGETK